MKAAGKRCAAVGTALAAIATMGALVASAAAASATPAVQSAQVSFYAPNAQHSGARIVATVTDATAVSLTLQAGGVSLAQRIHACDPSYWHLQRPTGRLRLHQIGADRWEVRITHQRRALAALGSEIALFHFTAENASDVAHTTFTRDACNA